VIKGRSSDVQATLATNSAFNSSLKAASCGPSRVHFVRRGRILHRDRLRVSRMHTDPVQRNEVGHKARADELGIPAIFVSTRTVIIEGPNVTTTLGLVLPTSNTPASATSTGTVEISQPSFPHAHPILSTSVTSTTDTVTTLITLTTEISPSNTFITASAIGHGDLSSKRNSILDNKPAAAGMFSAVGLVLVLSFVAAMIWVKRRRAKRRLASVIPFRIESPRSDGTRSAANQIFEILSQPTDRKKEDKFSKVDATRREKPSVLPL